jgi:hypothetical protein
MTGCCECGDGKLGSIKCGEFIDRMRNYQCAIKGSIS